MQCAPQSSSSVSLVYTAAFYFSQDGAEQIPTILRTFGRGVLFARGVVRGEDGWVATEGKL